LSDDCQVVGFFHDKLEFRYRSTELTPPSPPIPTRPQPPTVPTSPQPSRPSISSGTGFSVSDGLILTNYMLSVTANRS
jgi:hypothetical protein